MSTVTTDIASALRGRLDGMAGLRPMLIDRILVGPDAIEGLTAEVAAAAGEGTTVILEDAVPMHRHDADLKDLAHRLVSVVGASKRVVLGPASGSLHANEEIVAQARTAVAGAACVVTVGSGTLTDVGKDACHANGGIPLVAVQTAASVNGYADDMAVLVKDGVKRTTPSAWPTSLVIDTQILRDAPPELTRSGFAEMMAMFTAPADWRLASAVGADRSYRHEIVDLFRLQGGDLISSASQLASGDGPAIDLLASLLTTSGIAMGVAGRTAPLSGTEHLISHLLDMSAEPSGVAVGLHGAQVGVAAVMAAVIWDRMLRRLESGEVDLEFVVDEADAGRRVRLAFEWLDSTGAAAEECWSGYRAKFQAWSEASAGETLAGRLEEALPQLRSIVGDAREMVSALRAVGAPTRFSELEPAVGVDRARWAVASCHLMRDRFTVVDLADFTGNWTHADVDEVFEKAAEAGGGW